MVAGLRLLATSHTSRYLRFLVRFDPRCASPADFAERGTLRRLRLFWMNFRRCRLTLQLRLHQPLIHLLRISPRLLPAFTQPFHSDAKLAQHLRNVPEHGDLPSGSSSKAVTVTFRGARGFYKDRPPTPRRYCPPATFRGYSVARVCTQRGFLSMCVLSAVNFTGNTEENADEGLGII